MNAHNNSPGLGRPIAIAGVGALIVLCCVTPLLIAAGGLAALGGAVSSG
ncbi:hypothetical protein HLB23_12040 [Nocardia uniformis]|uniref:Uncharacterized protein n=1 Tax=Nocardia uniformis TaxID=53432 RepID=A0A849BVG1_9NOCA|nr:hypothetical protein [Nocardia uniformis]NNH70583.1 hypothetical protein [Nocardia uniformis]